MDRLVVVARRSAVTLGRPIESHRGEQFVASKTAFHVASAIAPGATLLEQPRTQPSGRVIEPMRDRLRASELNRGVAAAFAEKRHGSLMPSLFTRSVQGAIGHPAQKCGQRHQQMDMNAV